MKYLRVVIFFLVLVLVAVGSYYGYLLIKDPQFISRLTGNKSTSESGNTTSILSTPKSTPIPSELKTKDITSNDLSPDQEIKIEGRFQTSDSYNQEINGIPYVRVIGILNDGGLMRIILTKQEFSEVSEILAGFKTGYLITASIRRDGIEIKYGAN
jgi:hypothetical protein